MERLGKWKRYRADGKNKMALDPGYYDGDSEEEDRSAGKSKTRRRKRRGKLLRYRGRRIWRAPKRKEREPVDPEKMWEDEFNLWGIIVIVALLAEGSCVRRMRERLWL